MMNKGNPLSQSITMSEQSITISEEKYTQVLMQRHHLALIDRKLLCDLVFAFITQFTCAMFKQHFRESDVKTKSELWILATDLKQQILNTAAFHGMPLDNPCSDSFHYRIKFRFMVTYIKGWKKDNNFQSITERDLKMEHLTSFQLLMHMKKFILLSSHLLCKDPARSAKFKDIKHAYQELEYWCCSNIPKCLSKEDNNCRQVMTRSKASFPGKSS